MITNPSDLTKAHLCYIGTPSASTTYDFAAGDLIDMEPFEYVLVTLVQGTTTNAIVLTATQNATNAATGEAALASGGVITTAATDDLKLFQMEIRTHGLSRYLQLDMAVGAGATPGPVCVVVHGIGFKKSAEATDVFPTLTAAAVGLHGGAGLA